MSLGDAVATVRKADAALNGAGPTPFPVPAAGLEPVIAGTVSALRATDWWLPGLRERVGGVLRETPIERLADGFAGSRPYRVVPPTPSPANRALYAVGLALSSPDRAAVAHLGIGSASDGSFYEALNAAALTGANVVFVVSVHPLGEGAPIGPQVASSPARVATAVGVETHEVDGTDVEAVHRAVSTALSAGGAHLVQARLGQGDPQ